MLINENFSFSSLVCVHRSELGKISLDYVFSERESLNLNIVEVINKASEAWGITSLRYEIRKYCRNSVLHSAQDVLNL